jgi:hypothetical protein
MTTEETLDLALEALEESVDLVREDYENAKKLYSNYPSRQARLLGLEDGLSKHEAAITAIKQARSAPVQEPVGVFMEDDDIGHARLIPHQQMKLKDGDKLYATPPAQPAPVQEPVATLWQHGETGRTRITMPGDITDCDARWFKAADLYTTPPAAQRQWVGLTDEQIHEACWESYIDPVTGECSTGDRECAVRWALAKLKELNT